MKKIKLLLVEDDLFYQRIVEVIIKANFPEIVISGLLKKQTANSNSVTIK